MIWGGWGEGSGVMLGPSLVWVTRRVFVLISHHNIGNVTGNTTAKE